MNDSCLLKLDDCEAKINRFRSKRTRRIMEFRLETVYLGAKRFLYEKKSKITIESKTIKIPIPVKNDEMTVVKIPLHLGTDCYIRKISLNIYKDLHKNPENNQ